MESIAIFYLGVIAGIWTGMSFKKTDAIFIEHNKLIKKHRDIINWLRSLLSESKNNKLSKNIDRNKVRLLEIIIGKLKK